MNLLAITEPAKYLCRLRLDPKEVDQLYERILIKTTGFFRDPSAFDSLKYNVLYPLVRSRSLQAPIRVWVVGCSTGEEVYSIAMSLLECFDRARRIPSYRILATDLSDVALEQARLGRYSNRRMDGVSPGRRSRFFTKTADGYAILPTLRAACIFRRHDLVESVPFSRIDLVTCRNVLMYMESDLQRRALSRLRFSVRPGGYLMLGMSESVRDPSKWEAIDPGNRIYQRL